MITQVFPDEFHLNTLDQLLPAIARLNPHVNIKAIVIGLMDRLSAYAERESESESPEDRQKSEEEATIRLLDKLRISKEAKLAESKEPKPGNEDGEEKPESEHRNGEQLNGATTDPSIPSSGATTIVEAETSTAAADSDDKTGSVGKRSRGIPENVRLYEIFYGQVTHLVHAQRLPIQDTIAMLVSLANLALFVFLT